MPLVNLRHALSLFILLSAFICHAQRSGIVLHTYGFEDGLAHRNTQSVWQDESGFIWVATAKGLNRFDGHSFLHWTATPEGKQLPNSAIQTTYPGPTPGMRLLVMPDQLLFFETATGQPAKVPFAEGKPAAGKLHRAVATADGAVWAVVQGSGREGGFTLYKTGQNGALSPLMPLPDATGDIPIASAAGRVLLGAQDNQIWVFDALGNKTAQYELPAPASDPSWSKVLQLLPFGNDKLWVILNHAQVGYLDLVTGYYHRHPISDQLPDHLRLSALHVRKDGDLWLGGEVTAGARTADSPCSFVQAGPALFHYEASAERLHNYSYQLKDAVKFNAAPRQIFEDGTGSLWLPTEFGLVLAIRQNHFQQYLAGGNECCQSGVCSMRGMTEDDAGNIYFTYYNGIQVLRRSTGTVEPLGGDVPLALSNPFGLLWHRGYLWTGSGQRIRLTDLKTQTVVPDPAGGEGVLLSDSDGDVWFGCANNLLVFPQGEVDKMYRFSERAAWLPDSVNVQITFLFQSSDGRIWVATDGAGVYTVSKEKGLALHLSSDTNPALPHARVLGLTESGGRLWIATAAGLAAYDFSKKTLKTFTTANGLPNDFINAVLPEGDSVVWASTDNGLARLHFASGRFANFFQEDGLSRNEFNRVACLRANDGRLFFGGLDGVNAFYPNRISLQRLQNNRCRIVLSQATWFDGEKHHQRHCGMGRDKGLSLSYRDKMLTVWFGLTDFTSSDLHRYRYRLNGYDKAWSEPSPANFARFFNLPAGRYRLLVKASTDGNNWLEQELSLPVNVAEAFYKSPWFLIVSASLAVLLIYAFMQYRLHLARRSALALEKVVHQRTQELETEKQKSESLLLNILPVEIAAELKSSGSAKARRHEQVTVLFSDFRNFSTIASQLSPEALVMEIDQCFTAFDAIMDRYSLEKIKTVGDAYLCAGGLELNHSPAAPPQDATLQVIRAAQDIQDFLRQRASERQAQNLPFFEARIGIHTGPVVAGIVGSRKFAFDIWGQTVNIAQRLESAGKPGRINISQQVFDIVKDTCPCQHRGKIEVKNIGEVEMYFVENKG